MDMETENILKQWDLTDYIDVFKDNEIDALTLSLLNNDNIKELIKPISGTARDLTRTWRSGSKLQKTIRHRQFHTHIRVGVLYVSQSIRSRTRSESESFVDALTEKHKNIVIPLSDLLTDTETNENIV